MVDISLDLYLLRGGVVIRSRIEGEAILCNHMNGRLRAGRSYHVGEGSNRSDEDSKISIPFLLMK